MHQRSRAREVALQLLFQFDQNPKPVPRADLEQFATDRLGKADAIAFCFTIYDGVQTNRTAIDKLITETADNWRLTRMNPSDRNVLRIGVFELVFSKTSEPVAAILNEAIELARRYGTEDSPAFVNGILDKVAKAKPTTDSTASAEAPTAES